MSVILFEQDDINKLLGMVKHHYQEIAQTIQFSPYYSHYKNYYHYHALATPKSEDKILVAYIARMLWYTIVSNRVAYMLQYKTAVSFFDIIFDFDSIVPITCTQKMLFEQLSLLDYNISTNDSNKFIEQKWYESFKMVVHRLAYNLIK